MLKIFALLYSLAFLGNVFADNVVWSGAVSSDGSLSPYIKLIPGQLYQIKVTGTIAIGKWSKNGQPLVNDANYEFNAVGHPLFYPVLRNNLDITLGDGKYHPDHVYQSAVFTAPKDEIHFWIFTTEYSDNTGAFAVEVSQVNPKSSAPTPIWKGTISAEGPPSPKVQLTKGQTYQIEVSGHMSLGTWKNGKILMNDACYEFNAVGAPILLPSFRNTLDISVCDGKYHPNHLYQSAPFVAEKDEISFWIFDTDYKDNSGELSVQVNMVSKVPPQKPALPK